MANKKISELDALTSVVSSDYIAIVDASTGVTKRAVLSDLPDTDTTYTAGTNVAISGSNVISSTDTNTTYSVGDGGLTTNDFTSADHSKLNAIEPLADVTDSTNVVAALTAGTNIAIAGNGTISSTDTNTTYSAGSSSTLGLIKLEDDATQTTAASAITTTAARTYGLQINSSGQGVVNVPWVDTDTNTDTKWDGGATGLTAATGRTSLGLVIGTNVQAYDADTAKTDTAQEYTAQQNFNATTLTFDATQDWNLAANQVTSLTLTANTTFDAPTNQVDGSVYVITLIQDGTGNWTAGWNAVFKFAGGTAPTLTTAASAKDILTFVSNGTNMQCIAQVLNVS
jgi:hypothetical protein